MKLDGQQKLYTYIELHVQSISFWDHALASSLPNPLHSLKYWARDQMKNQDCLSEHVQISLVQILQKADQSSKENRTVQHYQKQDGKAKST